MNNSASNGHPTDNEVLEKLLSIFAELQAELRSADQLAIEIQKLPAFQNTCEAFRTVVTFEPKKVALALASEILRNPNHMSLPKLKVILMNSIYDI